MPGGGMYHYFIKHSNRRQQNTNNYKIILSIKTMNRCGSSQMTVQGDLPS